MQAEVRPPCLLFLDFFELRVRFIIKQTSSFLRVQAFISSLVPGVFRTSRGGDPNRESR